MEFARAPYNFIPLSKRVLKRYPSIEELPPHDEIIKGTYTGTIEYKIKAESDIILSDGTEHFFKNTDGKYAIPGTSIRGMIRNNTITLGFSQVGEDIEDSKFLYRRFAKGKSKIGNIEFAKPLNKEYQDRLGKKSKTTWNGNKKSTYSILENIKAGYIKCLGEDNYIIVKANEVKNKTYFRISEEKLEEKVGNRIKEIKYLYHNGRQNQYYAPYSVKISFELNEDSKFIKSIEASNKLKYQGTIMSSGFMFNKNAHYIVNEKSSEKPINIDKKDIRAYKEYYRRDKKSGDYYLLPEKGKEKAAFYVEYNERIYFGFTPYLRLFYDKSIHDGIPDVHKEENIIDYNKALFGFANGNAGYKSRISFEDAVVEGSVNKENVELTLAGPKATCIAHYLEQNKKVYSTYNQDDSEIRGIKFYWMKDSKAVAEGKGNVNSHEEAIKEGACFNSKISFTNLSEDELGLLLYSLCLEEGCYQQIGKAKPYGYGRIKICDVKVQAEDLENRYSNLFENKKIDINPNKIIESYKEYASQRMYDEGITKEKINIEEDRGIKILLNSKKCIVSGKDYDYMGLSEFKDFRTLKNVFDILKLDKGPETNEKSNSDNKQLVKENSNKNKKISYVANDNNEKVSDDMLKMLMNRYNNN